MSLWFVTPAWQRYELSGICFEQRARVIDTLAAEDIEAHCIVVADDENLDLARAVGFDTVERDNEWLGRKFNDGIEYAGFHGATWIVPIGSDSWIDPAYFLPMPERGTRTSHLYCAVTDERLGELRVTSPSGVGPYMLHRSQLLRSGFRPARDDIGRYIDSSTIKGLDAPPDWRFRDVHPYQYVGFRGEPHLTSYERLMARWGVAEHDPWPILARYYPVDLVQRARAALAVAVAA